MAEQKNTESAPTVARQMMQRWTVRQKIEERKADGWTFVRGEAPDGKHWRGDVVLMEIPLEIYEKIVRRNREACDLLTDKIESGLLPVDTAQVEHLVSITHRAEKTMVSAREE